MTTHMSHLIAGGLLTGVRSHSPMAMSTNSSLHLRNSQTLPEHSKNLKSVVSFSTRKYSCRRFLPCVQQGSSFPFDLALGDGYANFNLFWRNNLSIDHVFWFTHLCWFEGWVSFTMWRWKLGIMNLISLGLSTMRFMQVTVNMVIIFLIFICFAHLGIFGFLLVWICLTN